MECGMNTSYCNSTEVPGGTRNQNFETYYFQTCHVYVQKMFKVQMSVGRPEDNIQNLKIKKTQKQGGKKKIFKI